MNGFARWLVLLCSLHAAQAGAQGAIQDSYSPLVEWRQPSGWEITPMHVGLLPNGSLFFVNAYNFLEHPEKNLAEPGFEPEFAFLMQTTPAHAPTPASVLVQPMPNPAPLRPFLDTRTNTIQFKTLACSGHALMADGSLFFASGVDAIIDLNLYNAGRLYESLSIDGIAESLTYNPATGAWKSNPNTIVPGPVTGDPLRWYATVTRLADSRMLVTGGYERVFPLLLPNSSVEVFDPAANSWSAVSTVNDTPEGVENPDYPHVFQFPYAYGTNIVMMLGGSAEPLLLFMTGQEKFWHRTRNFRPGAKEYLDAAAPQKVFPNKGSSSALLPIRLPEDSWGYGNGSVINVGGAHDTPMEGRIDVYDPFANSWRPSISMNGLRHHPSTVLLPDGRVLILAGHDDVSSVDRTGYAEYVDPKNNFALSQGSARMPETRGYHALTVLLPDGRVLVGGGNEDGRDAIERSDFRYYYPDYMFKTRPQLLHAQDTIKTAEYSLIIVPHGTRVDEAALVGLGSMTHSFDMNQRHVQLRVLDPGFTMRVTSAGWAPAGPDQCVAEPSLCYDLHIVQAPESKEMAPPGHYMLFILDENRVPSPGRILKLE